MKTKDEIKAENHFYHYSQRMDWAMDSYAEQMAIGFAEWIFNDKNVRIAPFTGRVLYKEIPKTIKELYQLYLKSIEK